jgi:hypothetical protein
MVQMTTEQALAYIRNQGNGGAGQLTQFDRDIIGPPVRLEIPLDSVSSLRVIGELFRSLADQFETLSGADPKVMSDRIALLAARQAVRDAQHEMRTALPRAKPQKPYQRRQAAE